MRKCFHKNYGVYLYWFQRQNSSIPHSNKYFPVINFHYTSLYQVCVLKWYRVDETLVLLTVLK